MLPVVKASEMAEMDRKTIQELGIPGITLMENAGLGVVREIERISGCLRNKCILIFCGKGNNGGDGYVVARHLLNRGANVETYLIGEKAQLKGDALINCQILESMRHRIIEIATVEQLPDAKDADLLVDGLLGTGVIGPVKGLMADVIKFMNNCNAPVVAIDLPSGMEADTGAVKGECIRAVCTVTMALLKRGLLFSPGREFAGKVVPVDISMPLFVIKESKPGTFLIERRDVAQMLPDRAPNAYKNACGCALALAGSVGLSGAAALTSLAILRAGAGMAILGTPESLNPIYEQKLTEVMTKPLPETENHTLSLAAKTGIEELLDWADVLAVGPGLGSHEQTTRLVHWILKSVNKPIVLDADGLNACKGNMAVIREASGSVVLTPHPGELSRIIGLAIKDIITDPIEIARKYARELNAVLVIKGAPTVTASPDGEVIINSTGNAGMATAGSGDVLTGIIAGLLAQGMSTKSAAIAGVYLHGAAGDIAARKRTQAGMIAGDILDAIPRALKLFHS
ncbi:NAD(P)H-hydrate dehydratase [candidate division KSB1 bacterium]|nr:NAD(P)H-hydrate dehydratase [candidate division KSB1 bacterium]